MDCTNQDTHIHLMVSIVRITCSTLQTDWRGTSGSKALMLSMGSHNGRLSPQIDSTIRLFRSFHHAVMPKSTVTPLASGRNASSAD